MTIFADDGDVHPALFVTVYVYVPTDNPDIILLTVFPEIAPGLSVQFPAGKPFSKTLPVATEQLGCAIASTVGADGVTGCALMTILADAAEVHPPALVIV